MKRRIAVAFTPGELSATFTALAVLTNLPGDEVRDLFGSRADAAHRALGKVSLAWDMAQGKPPVHETLKEGK